MTKKFLWVFLILMFPFGSALKAEHVYGGDITYSALGGDQYEIIVTLFLDCNSATDPSDVNIWAFNVVDGTPRLLTANEIYSGFVDTTYQLNLCLLPPPGTCLKKEIYSVITTLESGLGGFSLHLEEFNRSANILNLTQPDNYGAIFYCTVPDPSDPFSGGAHNGPVFNSDPPPVICINDTVRFDHSVIDPDGDVIIYKFCDPKGRLGIAGAGPEFVPRPYPNVPWSPGYNTNDQLPSVNPFTIDPNSGELFGIANQQGFYVYSVCFEEYRNGVLINEGNRDYMFRITANCTPKTTIVDFASQTQNPVDGYCGDLSVQFNENTTNGLSFDWDFGDGNNSNLANPLHQYTAPGDYNVTLTINKGMTCELSISKTFEVYPIVEPITINNVLAQCANDNSFDFSFAGIYNSYNTINWDFGPNASPNNSPLENPINIQFNQSGFHTVTVTVDNKTCSETDDQTVLIKPSPIALFTLPDSICIRDTLYLESNSIHTSNRTLKWTHSGASLRKVQGDSIRWVLYNQTGFGIVRLIVEDNGCRDTLVDSVYVQELPKPNIIIASNKTQCIDGNSFKIKVGGTFSPTTTKRWTFNTGASIITSLEDSVLVSFSSSGFHSFILEVKDGPCSVILSDSVYVSPKPVPNFTLISGSCLDTDTVDFLFTGQAGSSAKFTWDFGDSSRYQIISSSNLKSVSILDLIFTDTGYYTVQLELDEYGCRETFENTYYVGSAPTSNFNQQNAQCIDGNSFDFIHLGEFGPSAQFNWDFGINGPANSTNQNPSNISFNNNGLHVVTLTTTNNGCSSSSSQTIHVSAKPLARFSLIQDTCINSGSLDFIFNGIAGDSAIYTWDLGSAYTIGGISDLNDQNVLDVQYLNSGLKTVTLHIDENGCSSDYSQTFELYDSPIASYTPGAPQCILINEFDISNEGTYSNNATFEWVFGSLGPSNIYTEDALGITFDSVGLHNVVLTVSDFGCSDTFQQQISVTPEPTVYFAKQDTQCLANNSFEFVAQGFFNKGSDFSWDFGSQGIPSTANIKNPTSTFLDTGWHVVSVTVYEYGCTNTFTDSVYVSPVPDIHFETPLNQCISGNSYDFSPLGNFDDQATFEWFFPTGNPNYSSSKFVNNIKFQDVGFNQIELRVHSHGCTVVYKDSAELSPGPLGNIEPEESQCVIGNKFDFDFTGSTYTSNTNFTWIFGDQANYDTVRQQFPPTITYKSPGIYFAYLILQEDTCVDQFSRSILVSAPPQSNFKINSPKIQCLEGNSYEFLNTGQYSDSVYFYWNFGPNANPTSSSLEHPPTVNYLTTGWHIIELAVEENGCTDTIKDSIYISAKPNPAISPVDTQCVSFNNFSFDGGFSSFDTNALFTWDLGLDASPISDTGISISGVSFSNPGWHEISLTISENNCDSIARTNFFVNPIPIADFDTSNVTSCVDVNSFDFINTGSYSNQATWKWYFENATTDSLFTENAIGISFTDTGFHQVQLHINDYGCSDIITKSFYVDAVPLLTFENNTVQCVGNNNYNFQAQNVLDSNTQASWIFEDASPANATGFEAINIVFHDTGWQKVTLNFSLNGCFRSYLDSVYINPRSIPFFSNKSVQCVDNNSYDFTGAGSYTDSATFYWVFENASIDTGIGLNQSGIIFNQVGFNTISFFISDNGCTDVFVDSIWISAPPKAVLDSTSPQCITGNTFNFSTTNSDFSDSAKFHWTFENAFPANSTIENPAGIEFQATGNHLVTLIISENGCADSISQFVSVTEHPDALWNLLNTDNLQCILGNSFNFMVSDTSHESIAQITWDFGANASQATAFTDTVYNVSFNALGFELVKLTVSEYQCTDSYTDTIWIDPRPIPVLEPKDTQCVNNNFYSFDVVSSSFGAKANFLWDFGPNANIGSDSSSSVDSVTFNSIGIQNYSLTIFENGCDSTVYGTLFISNVSDPSFAINNSQQCISGNAFQFSSNHINNFSTQAEYFFTIETDTFRTSSHIYSFQDTGSYVVWFTVIDRGCRDSISSIVTVYPESEANFGYTPQEGCAPLKVNFQDSSTSKRPLSYFWDFGDGNIANTANPANTYQNSGHFDVLLIVAADSFCTSPDSLLIPRAVFVHNDPISDFSPSSYSSSMFDPEITFYSNSGDTVTSTFIIEQQQYLGNTVTYIFPDTGWYTIYHSVISPIGCTDSSSQFIYIEPELKFFSPNAFSPNGDGINDVFLQKGYAISSYELKIFNRWGEQIFESKDQLAGWNGVSQGAPAKEDIYAWRVNIVDLFGKEWHYKGSVSLIK